MAITPAIDLDEALIVSTGGECTVRQRDLGNQPVGLARIADPNSPGKAIGLRTNHADITTEIDEAVTRAELKTDLRGSIGCIFLPEATKIELHARLAEMKLAVYECHFVEPNEWQHGADR